MSKVIRLETREEPEGFFEFAIAADTNEVRE